MTLLLRVHAAPGALSQTNDQASFLWVAATLTIEPPRQAVTPTPTQEPLLTPAERDALPKAVPVADVPPTPTPIPASIESPVQAQALGREPEPVPSVPEPEPTPAPLPPAPKQPPPSTAGRLSEGQAREVLVAAGWPQEAIPAALSVACGIGNLSHPNGESGCTPGAKNPYGPYYGLFQLWSGHAQRFGYTIADLYDPLINARIALVLWQENGWAIWDVKP